MYCLTWLLETAAEPWNPFDCSLHDNRACDVSGFVYVF